MTLRRILWVVLPAALMSSCASKPDERAGVLQAINTALYEKGEWCIPFDQVGEIDRTTMAGMQVGVDDLVGAKLIQVTATTIQQASVLGGTISAPGFKVTLTELGKAAYSATRRGFCLGKMQAEEVTSLDLRLVDEQRVGTANYSYSLPNLPNWAKGLTSIPEVKAIASGQYPHARARIEGNRKGFLAHLLNGE